MRIFLFFFFFFSFFNLSFGAYSWALCPYDAEFQECINVNKSGAPESIEDFVCTASTSAEEIVYQIVLDKKFQEIDKDVEEYISWLAENKDYYFWPKKQEHFYKGLDGIDKKFSLTQGEITKRYLNLCGWNGLIIKETLSCFDDTTSFFESKNFFKETICQDLAYTKVAIAKSVAEKILYHNKIQIRRDTKKEYFQIRRTIYDDLLQTMAINLGYLERMLHKWPSKIRSNAH